MMKMTKQLAAVSMLLWALSLQLNGAEIASLSNPVGNGSIVADGAIGDWAGISGYGVDDSGDGAGGYDLSQLYIAHDESNYYVRVSLFADEVNFGGSAAGMWTIFDTDKNSGTGIAAFASGLGAEWNGSGVSQFNGWDSGGAHTGSILGGLVTGARSGDNLEYEYSIPRSVFGTDSFYVAVQSEFGTMDTLPAGAGNWYEYHADPIAPPAIQYQYATDPSAANAPPGGGVLADPLNTKLTDGMPTDANWLTGGQFVGSQDPAFVPANLSGDNELPQPRVEFSFAEAQAWQSVDITYLVDDEAKLHAPDAVIISFSQAGSEFSGDLASFGFDNSDDLVTDPVGQGALRTLTLDLGGITADAIRLDFLNDYEWSALGEITFHPVPEPAAGVWFALAGAFLFARIRRK